MARICFVCISLRAGGTERVVTRLANAFCEDHSVSIVIVNDGDPFYYLDGRVELHRGAARASNCSDWRRALFFLRHLRGTTKRIRPDVILSFGELISPLARLATLGSGARFVAFNRESPMKSLRGRAGILNPLIYPLANAVVTQTELAKQLLKRRYRFTRFAVIPNPVEVPAKVPPVGMRSRRIVSVGYLGGEKNQQALLRAFASSADRNEWKLDIVGDGPERTTLVELARSLGIAQRVDFLGERKNVSELLSDSRIFAFTSLSEGFPNALSEALAHGCACIAFDCVAGPADLIQDDRNGILIPSGDQEAYCAGLQSLMRDESQQSKYGESARLEIQRYSKDTVFQRYAELALEGIEDRRQCDS